MERRKKKEKRGGKRYGTTKATMMLGLTGQKLEH
jgi:hypothetical protein